MAMVLQNAHRYTGSGYHQESVQPTKRQTVEVYSVSDHSAIAGALQICNISISCCTNGWRLLVLVKPMRWFQRIFVSREPARLLSPTDSGVTAITPRDC
jgi:hypothetical protein